MALDVGSKTIGIALTDELLITAQGLETYKRIGIKKDTEYILSLIKEKNCGTLVIGLPLNLDGTDSIQTEKVRAFREKMENKLRSNGITDIVVDWQDERYSTVEAEDVLILANLSREERKKVIDKQAAVIILQSYMDRMEHLTKMRSDCANETDSESGETAFTYFDD
ncbi:MAG: Holliday junction resolvase RuvX [Firmicutes bacterium]|nr:Holliday junction resolvase RuvX [Bacillota bacterium]